MFENSFMKNKLIKPALVFGSIICIAIIALYACSKSGSGYGSGATGGANNGNSVSIKNFAFSVATLNVTTGTKVTWTNNDNTTHTVTADDGSFDSGNIAPGETFSKTFTVAGTVNYHCSIHTGMKASVIVK